MRLVSKTKWQSARRPQRKIQHKMSEYGELCVSTSVGGGTETSQYHLEKRDHVFPRWQQLRLKKSEVAESFASNSNIGILLGEASKNLVDIRSQIVSRQSFWPRCFCRKHKRCTAESRCPGSHHWYRTERSPKPEKFSDIDGSCLVEIRSTGQQTVVPPSIHPSGERLHREGQRKSPNESRQRNWQSP